MTRPFAGPVTEGARLTLALCALALAGCATNGAGADTSAAASGATPGYTRVTLERKPCFGTCPVYRVAVSDDGAVVFEGVRHVDSIGRFTGRIDPAGAAELARLFEQHDYFALDDRYGEGEANCRPYATDAPTVITSVSAAGRTKQVEHDLGCSGVPPRLYEIERRIDEIVGTARWIRAVPGR